MIENIKETNFTNKITSFLKTKYKILIFLIIIIILLIASIQFYFYNIDKKILKTSIKYNLLKSDNSKLDFEKEIDILSNQKNFYGILASLEKIKFKLKNKNLESAYLDYINLLNQKKINNLYKSVVAVHGSYALINSLDIENITQQKKMIEFVISKVRNLLDFIDPTLENYNGYRLEILYLLAILDYKKNANDISYDESKKLYKQIQENDKISPTLKERVRKIYESEEYN